MATSIQEVKAKLAEYETASEDASAKQSEHQFDQDGLMAAVSKEQASRTAWISALQHAHAVEDQLEAAIIDHEPPDVPVQP